MMIYSSKQKVLIVKLYYMFESPIIVRREFCRQERLHTALGPSRQAISRIVYHFENKFSVENKNKGNSGKSPNKTKNPDIIEDVRDSVNENPHTSIRQRSSELDISRMSLQRILRKELLLYPYVISVRHVLTAQDKVRRTGMCRWMMDRMDNHPGWIDNVWFTDEAHFHQNGAVNNHNNIFWGNSLPEETSPRNLRGKKVTAFVAYNARHGLLGPYWFEEDGKTVTITGARYREVVTNFTNDLRALLSPRQFQTAWYMQDGAPPHTAHDTITLLKTIFKRRLVALGTDVEWAPHSPDLNPLDFWLWGAAKEAVYRFRPDNLDFLKQRVAEYLRQIPPETFRKVRDNFKIRVRACLRRQGRHIENINYHKV